MRPSDRDHTCCFTKGYGKLAQGAGSVLQTSDYALPEHVDSGKEVLPCRLRYFTPREVARLHGFPESLVFPPRMNPRLVYRVLGLFSTPSHIKTSQ